MRIIEFFSNLFSNRYPDEDYETYLIRKGHIYILVFFLFLIIVLGITTLV